MADSPTAGGRPSDDQLLARLWDWSRAATESIDAADIARHAVSVGQFRSRTIVLRHGFAPRKLLAVIALITVAMGALLLGSGSIGSPQRGVVTSFGPAASPDLSLEPSPSPAAACQSGTPGMFCPNFGTALIRLEDGSRRLRLDQTTTTRFSTQGDASAIAWHAPLITQTSFANDDESTFIVEYRQPNGYGLRITGRPTISNHLHEPGWTLEIDEPDLGNRFVDDGTTCAIDIVTVPPDGVSGTYTCPGIQTADGSGWVDARGSFDSAHVLGVASIELSDSACVEASKPAADCGPFEPMVSLARQSERPVSVRPDEPFRFVFEDWDGYVVEISGLASPGTHESDAVWGVQMRSTGPSGSTVLVDGGCSITVDQATVDRLTGSYHCRSDSLSELIGVDTVGGSFSVLPGG